MESVEECQTVCLGRKKIGEAQLRPHQRGRLLLPKGRKKELREEIMLMVHMVLSEHLGAQQPRQTLSLERGRSLMTPKMARRPATRIRIYTGDEPLAGSSAADRERTRCIGVRRNGDAMAPTYRTESVCVPVQGSFLFVENLSHHDEARVTISALALKQWNEAVDGVCNAEANEPVYEEIDEVLRPLSVASFTSLNSSGGSTPGNSPPRTRTPSPQPNTSEFSWTARLQLPRSRSPSPIVFDARRRNSSPLPSDARSRTPSPLPFDASRPLPAPPTLTGLETNV